MRLPAKQRNPSRRGASSEPWQSAPVTVVAATVPSCQGSTVRIVVVPAAERARMVFDMTAAAFLSPHDASTRFAIASRCATVHLASGLTATAASEDQEANCHSSLLVSAYFSCSAMFL